MQKNTNKYCRLNTLLLLPLVLIILSIMSCDENHTEQVDIPPQKISSSLSQAITNLESPQKDEESLMISNAKVDKEGRLQIYVKLNEFSSDNLQLLKDHGLKVDIYDEQQKLVQGWALPKNIEIMSQFDFVKMIDLPNYGYTN